MFYGAKANNGSIISCFVGKKDVATLEATQNSIVKSGPAGAAGYSPPCQYTEVDLLPLHHSFRTHFETIYKISTYLISPLVYLM